MTSLVIMTRILSHMYFSSTWEPRTRCSKKLDQIWILIKIWFILCRTFVPTSFVRWHTSPVGKNMLIWVPIYCSSCLVQLFYCSQYVLVAPSKTVVLFCVNHLNVVIEVQCNSAQDWSNWLFSTKWQKSTTLNSGHPLFQGFDRFYLMWATNSLPKL